MLAELGLLRQRHKAVLEVLNGAPVTDTARRCGVARQTLHNWLRRHERNGSRDSPTAAPTDGSGRCHRFWGPVP